MQNPSLDTAHFNISKSSTSTMNDPLEDCLTHPHNQSSTRISSASTLYDILQDQNLVQPRDYFPHDVPQLIKLQSPDIESWDYLPYEVPSLIELQYPEPLQHRQSTYTKAGSRGWYPHKRRNTESDLRTPGLVRGEQPRLDGSVKRRRLRSASLNRGSAIYNTWTPDSSHRGATFLLEKDIRETSPHDIALLWDIVSMPSEAMGEETNRVSTRADSRKKTSETGQSSTNATSEITSSHVTTSKKGRKKKKNTEISDYQSIPLKSQGTTSEVNRISPYNKNFDGQILAPRSININPQGLHMKALVHFRVGEPPAEKTRREYYTQDRGGTDSTVWVEGDSLFVAIVVKSYDRMKGRGMCEAAFATYAKEKLTKQDDLLLDDRDDDDRSWRTERMVELVAKPERSTNWQAPPLLQEPSSADDLSATDYSFDLRPDCSYWLSSKAFNPEYRSQIGSWTFVMYRELVCPYFTIEFKKDNQSESRARSQVAAAASVALYNRYRLRETRLEKQGQPWTKRLTNVLRHYGLTVKGDEFTVWLILPTLSGSYRWAGCEMAPIGHGYCTDPHGVRDLIHWINEIHCWGLTSHGPRCAKDVKNIMQAVEKRTGFRPSDVKPDSEDGSDSEDEPAAK